MYFLEQLSPTCESGIPLDDMQHTGIYSLNR